MVFRPVETRGSVREVIDRLVEPLRSGGLRVGDRLPSERTTAEQLMVSRGTVRKGLRELVAQGVLESVEGRGSDRGLRVKSSVLPPRLLGRTDVLPIAEISGVLEARRVLEPRVAQLAALAAHDEDFERIENILREQRAAADDIHLLRRLDAQFHLAIAASTHNRTIMIMMHALYERLELTRYPSIQPNESTMTLDMQERTLRALRSRDPDIVDAVMDEHLAIMESAWERETGHSFKRVIPSFLAKAPYI